MKIKPWKNFFATVVKCVSDCNRSMCTLLDALMHWFFCAGSWQRSRLAKDFENLTPNALAFLHLASIRLMLRTLCLS
jgi:hypothetical protein